MKEFKDEFEILVDGFEVFELDLLQEEFFGGNNCDCTNKCPISNGRNPD